MAAGRDEWTARVASPLWHVPQLGTLQDAFAGANHRNLGLGSKGRANVPRCQLGRTSARPVGEGPRWKHMSQQRVETLYGFRGCANRSHAVGTLGSQGRGVQAQAEPGEEEGICYSNLAGRDY